MKRNLNRIPNCPFALPLPPPAFDGNATLRCPANALWCLCNLQRYEASFERTPGLGMSQKKVGPAINGPLSKLIFDQPEPQFSTHVAGNAGVLTPVADRQIVLVQEYCGIAEFDDLKGIELQAAYRIRG